MILALTYKYAYIYNDMPRTPHVEKICRLYILYVYVYAYPLYICDFEYLLRACVHLSKM